ncbi:MAG: hypothetical protein CMM75_03370 [Rhodospirillaceae bacterium]|nr:hypothetical protein [Rhodospirillaceae bacterium]
MTVNRKKLIPKLMKVIPVFILAFGFAAFFFWGPDRYFSLAALTDNRDLLSDWVAQAGAFSWLVYGGFYAFVTAFSVPGGAVMTILGGFLFGPWLGGTLSVVGATVGATVVFLAARYAVADFLKAKLGSSLFKMEKGFNENPLTYLLFLRLIPLFPFWLINLIPALLHVPIKIYIFGTAIGIIPGTLIYSLLGDGLGALLAAGQDINPGIIFELRFLLPVCGLGVLVLMPVLYKKFRGSSAL